MLYLFYDLYILIINIYYLDEDDIKKINRNFNKNDLYIDYI